MSITQAAAPACSSPGAAVSRRCCSGGAARATGSAGQFLLVKQPSSIRTIGAKATGASPASAAGRALRVRSSGGDGVRVTTTAGSPSSDFAALAAHPVFAATSGQQFDLASECQGKQRCVVAFLTHFGDLSSTEFAQKLLPVLPELQTAGVAVLVVGLGETEKARRFAELLSFPLDILYADPTGSLYTALGFSPGFAPEANISAYAKLLPMLAGIGSPGTMQEVFRGYLGDRSAKPVFSGESNLFDVLGRGYQRPFELATLRLYNMNLVLSHWGELAPSDERLLTQQGGCIGFEGQQVVYKHVDAGILKYADVEEMVRVMLPAGEAPAAAATSQVLRPLL